MGKNKKRSEISYKTFKITFLWNVFINQTDLKNTFVKLMATVPVSAEAFDVGETTKKVSLNITI